MPYEFKIWNQSNDNQTMSIRVRDVNALNAMAATYAVPSSDGAYQSLQHFINLLDTAVAPQPPYRREVDVVWNTMLGYGRKRMFRSCILEATYSGNIRQGGGYAVQCYVMIDPNGYGVLGPFHFVPIQVEIITETSCDLLVVSV